MYRPTPSPRVIRSYDFGALAPDSALRPVPNVDDTVVEPAFTGKFELHGDRVRQIGVATAHDDRRDEHVVFVDQASSNGMRRETMAVWETPDVIPHPTAGMLEFIPISQAAEKIVYSPFP